MILLRIVAITTALATFGVTGCAQMPVGHGTQLPDASGGNMSMPMDGSDAQMARMDEQMKAMQAMHDKMMEAKTPEERSAMMAEHMEVMQNSMTMMSEMGSGGMMGKGDMKGMKGKSAMQDKARKHGDMDKYRQMMEKRMQMMQSMMQMMMDRMPPAPGNS